MAKIRLHIDPRGVDAKPTEREWGRISKRVLNPANIEEVTVQQLAQKNQNRSYNLPRRIGWDQGR